MTRRARTFLFGIAGCVVAVSVALFLWLPWNPFEADAGPLDEWVPSGADAVVRLDAGALRRSPVLRAIWEGAAGDRLRDEPDVAAAIEALADADRELAAFPALGGNPLSVEGDLMAGEVLLAIADDEPLLLTRISGRAKAVDLLRRLSGGRLAEMGLEAEGGGFVFRRGAAEIRFARRRDVLLVSTSEGLLASALELADGRGNPAAFQSAYRRARPEEPRGATIGVWAMGEFVTELAEPPTVGEEVFERALSGVVRIDVDATAADALRARVRLADAGCDVSFHAAIAESLADEHEAFAVGALPVPPADVLTALVDAQPPARRKLMNDFLAEKGTSLDESVEALSALLEPGAAFVVSRPRVLDTFRLDDAEGDPRFAIPVTTVVFRVRPGVHEALSRLVERQFEALLGGDSGVSRSVTSGGTQIFATSEANSFGPEWALLDPAFAIAGDALIVSTNRADFERSEQRLVTERTAPPVVLSLLVDAAKWRDRLLDLRYEVAMRETFHDWAAERREIRAKLARGARPEDAKRREDAEIEKRIAHRKDVEFPAAQRRYRESLRWLDAFEGAEVRCVRDGKALVLDATVRLR